MDVLVGPTFTIDVASSPPPYSADRPITAAANDRPYKFSPADSSDSDSSIGTPDDSSDDDDDVNDAVSSQRNQNDHDEVHSKLKGLASLDSLEDSLPIKRGLSNHFLGKSKSFTDLSQVTTLNTAKELQKQENPFNKRRRVQIATKWTRKSSFYAWSNPQSMPLLPVHEDEDEDDDYEEEDEKPKKVSPSSSSSTTEEKKQQRLPPPRPQSYVDHMRARFGSFKSRSLSDLKEHDEEEEEDDVDDDE